MPDNKNKPGNPDKIRINVEEPYELSDWSKKFNVSTDELKRAVKEAGTSADEVEAYLLRGSKASAKK
jgi:hypothetical protein